MIYISYGITKSASTFLYQMTEEVFRAAGRPVVRLGKPFRKADSVENYFNFIDHELLSQIQAQIGDRDIILKTHGPPRGNVAQMVAAGEVLASASIRDPREIALSMVDHGTRSRRWRNNAFSEFVDVADTLNSIDIQLGCFQDWADTGALKVFTYNAICYDSPAVIRAIAEQIGATIDAVAVLGKFRDKGVIGQFSKGKALRYSEMSATDQAVFRERYAALYAAYAFDTDEARRVAAEQASLTLRASGEVAQFITMLRRRFGF
ncbi:hypothetical protein FHT98_3422 [Bosea sp. AK1]|uniref:hypothetical protein n=1 Tax=Bosea sp. AK1 TaxID=2587160 RepID=UPI0011514125|nr:hypothetical protein [Bosea sp. AK1]TQI75638.1 hypothetical protein FHT98_3422 [Bosea sp. AK1]